MTKAERYRIAAESLFELGFIDAFGRDFLIAAGQR
jgi:hypothetical protein